MKRRTIITQTQAFRRGVQWNVAAVAASVGIFFASSWPMVVLVVVMLTTFHLAGFWFGWASAMRVGGHREMFAAGDGVLIQIVGAQLHDHQRDAILAALGELGTVERYDPEES